MAAKSVCKYILSFVQGSTADRLFDHVVKEDVVGLPEVEQKEWLLELREYSRGLDISPVWASASPDMKTFLCVEFPEQLQKEHREGLRNGFPTLNVSWECRCGEGYNIGRDDHCPNCDDTYETNMLDLVENPRENYLTVNDVLCASDETVGDSIKEFVGDAVMVKHCRCKDRECSCDLTPFLNKVVVSSADHKNLTQSTFGRVGKTCCLLGVQDGMNPGTEVPGFLIQVSAKIEFFQK